MIIFSISGLIRDYNNNNNNYDKVGRLSVCPSLIKFTLYHIITTIQLNMKYFVVSLLRTYPILCNTILISITDGPSQRTETESNRRDLHAGRWVEGGK